MCEEFYLLENLIKFKENACIIWKENVSEGVVYTYKDVIESAEMLILVLNDLKLVDGCKILCNFSAANSPAILPLTLSILNNACCFCPVRLAENELIDCLERYQANFFITDQPSSMNCEILRKLTVLGVDLYLHVFKENDLIHKLRTDRFCYVVQTSGSTGQPKLVNVPFDCIYPNILSLSEKFAVQSKDVIFVSSPPTFDPFFVDVFLALRNGAAILLVPTALRLLPDVLARILFASDGYTATICQITPSLFRRFHLELLRNFVFCENSPLRILVLGGEQFPSTEEIQRWPVWSIPERPRIFNIYGITEVSCWSSMAEICDQDAEVSLGDPLDSTTVLEVRSDSTAQVTSKETAGELYIGSKTRKCLIDNESPAMILDNVNVLLFRATGDLVEKRNNRLYFKNRTNAVTKRFGCKVNLKTIEEKIKRTSTAISDVYCVLDPENTALIAFIQTNNEADLSYYSICTSLDKTEKPDFVKFLRKFPLSCHGKVSKFKLLEQYRSNKSAEKKQGNISKIFVDKLNDLLGINEQSEAVSPLKKKARKISWDETSFLDVGGTSFLALRLVTELEEIVSCDTISNIFQMLLNDKCSLRNILSELDNSRKDRKGNCFDPTSTNLEATLQLKEVWKHDFEKCVDASVTVGMIDENLIVAVGSHSHLLACLDVENGIERIRITLPDRIEGQITIIEQFGVVGCYDGVLYKIDLKSGEIVQEFNSGGMIKCNPLFLEKFVIFGNYSSGNNFFCIDFENFHTIWTLKIGQKSIFASPIRLNKESVICCTLDGVIANVQYKTGLILWKHALKSPVFSTPVELLPNILIVAEVSGNVHCLDGDKKQCSFQCGGSIFSSLTLLQSKQIIFGCYDHCLYSLQFDPVQMILQLNWKIQLQSQVYATPKILTRNDQELAICCTTTGSVNIVEIKNRRLLQTIALKGEVFSSPAIYQNRLFVGCRDNFLYCLEIEGIK